MIEKLKQVHLVGIGGIGMSAIAKLLLTRDVRISGSDMYASEITQDLEKRGVKISIGHDQANIRPGVDMVIYSAAVQESNPERKAAVRAGINQLSYPEFLGELTKQYKSIVVTGTNGKSTTTAMIAKILTDAGYDPTVIVGTLIPEFEEGNFRAGKSNWFVVEGCEYREHMTLLHPYIGVITNIEEDHLDYYRDIDHIREAMQVFAEKSVKLILNSDDEQSKKIKVEGATYIESAQLDGSIQLQLPGQFNEMNALAAIKAVEMIGLERDEATKIVNRFSGVWRRFEVVGEYNDALIVSDYAHHPDAIEKTLAAAREKYPDKRFILCFQPHQHSRTKELLNDFAGVLGNADLVLIPDIYAVVGRTEKEEKEVSSQDLVDAIKKNSPDLDIRYSGSLEASEEVLREEIQSDDLVIIMGAGDVDMIARHLGSEDGE